jgi:hypothetical protein
VLVPPADSWKLVLAFALLAAMVASARAKPPRRPLPASELRRLVAGAIALYGVGLAASLTEHTLLAVVLYAAGIVVSSLAAWLSRGVDARGGPPGDDEPVQEPPPSSPDGAPGFDWPAFERDFAAYARRAREPARRG